MSQPRYTYALTKEALEFFASLSAKEQQKLLDYFRLLSAQPGRRGELQVPGLDGRNHQVVEYDGFFVTYWPDDAVQEVRITEIHWS